MSLTETVAVLREGGDFGLRLKMDDRLCPSPLFALLPSSLVAQLPKDVLQKINKVNNEVEKVLVALTPYLVYLSLGLVLGLQFLGVAALLCLSLCPLGLFFLLSCGVVLGALFLVTTSVMTGSEALSPSSSSCSLSSLG